MQLISFYEICTIEIPFEERFCYDTYIYTAGVTLLHTIMYLHNNYHNAFNSWQWYMHLKVLTFSSGLIIAEILLHKCLYNLDRICSLFCKSSKNKYYN